ncbi:MAG: adenylate/guanylate cyclase domain-containing protein [Candidatus Cloacimonetes bacterium]|nr:adenylate/guanylate cyclase domain-containing protein [Candidatus Cloacimonadota bacterium]
MKKIKFRFVIIFSIFVFVAVILLSMTRIYKTLELNWIDTNFNLRGPLEVSQDIVILDVSDEAFEELGRYPFPRSYFAHLIENLNKAGAAVIIFDIEFTEQTLPSEDVQLGITAAKYSNVIFAGKLSETRKGNSVTLRIVPPIVEITDRDLEWGLVGISQDQDGFVRKYTLFSTYADKPYYTIGVKGLQMLLAQQRGEEPKIYNSHESFMLGSYVMPKFSGNTVLINYYGPAHTFPYYHLDTVLDDSTFQVRSEKAFGMDFNTFDNYLQTGTFKDKIVLVGASAEELHDLFPTPFYDPGKGYGLTPGVEIHANFIEMVLHSNYLKPFSYLYLVLGLLILIFVINIIFNFFKPTINAIIGVLLIIGYLVFVYMMFKTNHTIVNVTEVPSAILISFLGNLVMQYYMGRKEKLFIKKAFQQYVAKDIVDLVMKDPKRLKFGGQVQELTVLFSDLRSFTTYTEQHDTKEVVDILREYLTEMVDVIKENSGTIDKFVGDAIMALFGVPYYYEMHAYNACKTALIMAERLRKLQEKWTKEGKDCVQFGIGIHTGSALVGNLGSEQIFDYTAIGDTINTGARIEPMNKEYETENHIIISETTYEAVKEKVEARYLDSKTLRGKGQPLKLYELLSLKEDVNVQKTFE